VREEAEVTDPTTMQEAEEAEVRSPLLR